MIKIWGFSIYDYKAAEAWLNELAKEGWELVKVSGCFSIVSFKKTDRKDLKYGIDLFLEKPADIFNINEYKAFCEESGWEHVERIGVLQIFKSKEGEDPIPLQTDRAMEAQTVKSYFIKKEFLPVLILTILLSYSTYRSYIDMDYRFLLFQGGMFTTITRVLILMIIIFPLVCTSFRIYKTKNGSNEIPDVKKARVAGLIHYWSLAILLIVCLTSLLLKVSQTSILISFIPLYILVASVVIVTFAKFIAKCKMGKIKRYIITGGVAMAIFVITMASIFTGIGYLSSIGDPVDAIEGAKKENMLLIADFYPQLETKHISGRFSKGRGIFAKNQYELSEMVTYEENGKNIVISNRLYFYQTRNKMIANYAFKCEWKEQGYNKAEYVDYQKYGADDGLYFPETETLLLIKGNNILILETSIPILEDEYAKVIEDFLT